MYEKWVCIVGSYQASYQEDARREKVSCQKGASWCSQQDKLWLNYGEKISVVRSWSGQIISDWSFR